MGLGNFIGLGASVGVKDDGATSFLTSFTNGLTGIGGALLNLGKVGADFGGMIQSHLTTPFEAQAQAYAASAHMLVANTGLTGKALEKASGQAAGWAMGLGISEKAAADAAATFQQFPKEMKAIGLSSGLAGAELEHSLHIPVRELTFDARRMMKEFGASDKTVGDTTKVFSGLGEKIGDVNGSFKLMHMSMELGSKRAALMAKGLSDISGPDVMKSVAHTAAALFDLGTDAQHAQAAAVGLEQKMSEAMEGFGNMFAGTAADLHPFLEEFSVVSGDVQQAFKDARKGPDVFVKDMAHAALQVREKLGPQGLEKFLTMFGGRMSQVLGSDVTDTLINAIKNVDSQSIKMVDSTKLMGRSLDQLAHDSFRSTKTLADQFEMITGAGLSAFRSIGRSAAVDLVQGTAKSFAEFNSYAKGLVKDGGVLGSIVEKLSEMSNVGPVAILPKTWRPVVAVFGSLYNNLSPALGAVTQLTGALTSFLNPVTLISAAIGGFVALVIKARSHTEDWSTAIEVAWEDAKQYLSDAGNKVAEWLLKVPWDKVASGLAEGLSSALQGLTRILSGGKNPMEEALGMKDSGAQLQNSILGGTNTQQSKMAEAADKIGGAFKDAFSKYDWGDLLHNFFETLRSSATNVANEIFTFLSNVLAGVDDAKKKALGKELGDILAFVFKEAIANIKTTAGIFEGAGGALVELAKGAFLGGINLQIDIFKTMIDLLKKYVVDDFIGVIREKFKKLIGASEIPDMFQKGFNEIRDITLKPFLVWIQGPEFIGALSNAFDIVTNHIKDQFRLMWLDIITATDLGAKEVQRILGSTLTDLSSLQQALETVKSAQAALDKGAAKTGKDLRRQGESTEDALLRVTNMPDWAKQYMSDFNNRMGELIAATKTASQRATPGSSEPAAAAVRAGVNVPLAGTRRF